jgi:iron complex transport system substrate-binding protein
VARSAVSWDGVRVVSLNCSNTEIVAALGCQDRLVGVDDDSDWPADLVARLPRVGRDLDIDIARVRALAPDLVLASLTVPGHEHVVEGLARAGLPFHAPRTQSLGDTYRDIRDIGAMLGVSERADAVIAGMRRAIERPPPPAWRPRILVQWWPKPVIAPGRRSWVHDLLGFAGAANPLGDRDVESAPLADDEVGRLSPDAFVISWCGVDPAKYRPDVVLGRPAWRELDAVRRGRVFCVAEAFLGRPGPRLVAGAEALRRIVAELTDGPGSASMPDRRPEVPEP